MSQVKHRSRLNWEYSGSNQSAWQLSFRHCLLSMPTNEQTTSNMQRADEKIVAKSIESKESHCMCVFPSWEQPKCGKESVTWMWGDPFCSGVRLHGKPQTRKSFEIDWRKRDQRQTPLHDMVNDEMRFALVYIYSLSCSSLSAVDCLYFTASLFP